MKKIKFFILSFFVLASLFFSSISFAQDANTTQISPSSLNIVAMIDIRDAKIVSQQGNVFNIAFTLINGEGLQGGVKYGVQLVPEGKHKWVK